MCLICCFRNSDLPHATGILTEHSRHLSIMGIISDPTCNYCEEGQGIMGIISDPTCNYCEEGLETAAHLCKCSHFVTQRQEKWGKSYLHPSEADSVQNLVRFIQKSHRFS